MSLPSLNEMINEILTGGDKIDGGEFFEGGGKKMVSVGSKSQVWHGTAKHTSGGLHKNDLMYTKHGRIVSKKKHSIGLKAIKHLRSLGYVAKKGTFKLFSKKRSNRSKKY